MANREQSGNREKRKPKAEKPKSAGKPSPFASTPAAERSGKGGRAEAGPLSVCRTSGERIELG